MAKKITITLTRTDPAVQWYEEVGSSELTTEQKMSFASLLYQGKAEYQVTEPDQLTRVMIYTFHDIPAVAAVKGVDPNNIEIAASFDANRAAYLEANNITSNITVEDI